MFPFAILLAYLVELLETLAAFILRQIGFGPIGPIKGMRAAITLDASGL